MAEPSGPRAGIGARFGAMLLDGLILGIVTIPIALFMEPVIANALSTVLGLAYYVVLEGGPTGQTFGKRAMSIRVIRMSDGDVLGPGGALIRYIGRIISTIPCGLGFLWALWDSEKQTWHDKIAGTVVVPVSSYPVS